MSDFREILRRTFEQRTLPSGLHVQLRPVGMNALVAAGRMPEDLFAFFRDRVAGVDQVDAEVVDVMIRYRRLEAAASVVEMWDADHWADARLTIEDLAFLDLQDQKVLLDYAAEHSELTRPALEAGV